MNAHTREPFHIRILKGLLGIIWSIDWPLMVIVLILSAWGLWHFIRPATVSLGELTVKSAILQLQGQR